MFKQAIVILLFLFSFSSQAKQTAVFVKFSQFMTDKQETYLELYFSIDANSLDYAPAQNNSFQGGIEVTVQVLDDSIIVAADKFRILSPLYNDTTTINNSLLHQQRFLLKSGEYTLKLDMVDINETEEHYSFSPKIELNLSGEKPESSDIMLLEDYKTAKENNTYARSGYELIPIVTSGSYFFPQEENKLSFYAELYNIDKEIGADSAYLIKYFLVNNETQQTLNQYASFSKKKAKSVEPVLASFNISNLPTGEFNLVIEALDKKGNKILEKRTFFYRSNTSEKEIITEDTFKDLDITGTFADRLGNLDSIYLFVEYLYPISTERQRLLQEQLLAEADEYKLKKYFYTYWQQKDANYPEAKWKAYHKEVRIVNKLYSSSLRKGYKTDRGRVYLVYGEPNRTDGNRIEPNMPPYEIWQYDRIFTLNGLPQTNRIFVFGEFEPSTREFQLIHSTALGELESRDWRRDLFYRAYGGPGSIDPSYNEDDRDFGNRTYQNVILNSTNSDGGY